MAEILDKDGFWELVINTTAKPVETIDEPDKGYKAVLGLEPDTDKHTVMNVQYDKSKYKLEEVVKKVDQLRNCNRCSTLDKSKLKLDKIQVGGNGQAQVREVTQAQTQTQTQPQVQRPYTYGPPQEINPSPVQQVQTPKPAIQDMLADAFFKAYFTDPGKYFMAVLMGDDKLLESTMPKTPEETARFMDQMIDFMTGEMELTRSPEQAKEFLGALKTGEEAGGTGQTAVRAKAKRRQAAPVITIY